MSRNSDKTVALNTATGPDPQPGTDDEPTLTIGDLAAEFSITTRTIRFYEARGLLAPLRRGTNRSYTRRDRARLRLILRGKNLGFTLEDISDYLSLYDSDPTQVTQTQLLLERVEMHIADLVKKRADLDRTLEDLKDIRTQCRRHLGRKA